MKPIYNYSQLIGISGAAGLSIFVGVIALAQSPPPTSAQLATALDAAWAARHAAAENAAIAGPDQLRAENLAKQAFDAWRADQMAQVTTIRTSLATAQKERDAAKAQVAAVQASSKAAETEANSLRAQLAARPTAADFQKALHERDAALAKPCVWQLPHTNAPGHKP